MRKVLLCIGLLSIVIGITACAQNDVGNEKKVIDAEESIYANIMEIVNLLPETRVMGTQNDVESTKIIKEYLESYDYFVELQSFEYNLTEQGFAFPINQSKMNGFPIVSTGESNNIIAYKKEKIDDKKNIIVCAHYDTSDVNEMNDNGIGVGTVLEIAKTVDDLDNYNIIYVLFTGELQLVGSQYYGNSLTDIEKGNIAAVINLDEICGKSEVKVGFNDAEKNEAYYIFEDVINEVVTDEPFNTVDSITLGNCGIPVMNIGQIPEIYDRTDVVIEKGDIISAYNILYSCLQSC